MADTRLPLLAQQANLTTVLPLFQKAREASQRNQLFPLQLQRQKLATQQQGLKLEEAIDSMFVQNAQRISPMLERGDDVGAERELLLMKEQMIRNNLPTDRIDKTLEAFRDPANREAFKAGVRDVATRGFAQTQKPFQFGPGRRVERIDPTTKQKVEGEFITIRDPITKEITSTFVPFGGELISPLGETADEAELRRIREAGGKAGATERAKLETRRRLEPELKASIQRAIDAAKAEADIAKEERSNAKAWRVYSVGIKGLEDALGGTITGPGAGRIPAVTAPQQIAEGAIAAMAPIMKQMFRSAGEGNFTDSDQEILLNMIPKRTDKPETIKSKLANIDAIVRAKLGQPIAAPKSQGPKIDLNQFLR